ncbi:MAG: SCO family protein [Gammaproteobacteria bacterium]|nr:SCO family protein [Gammaproteobacteria bacterium]MCW9055497.1 SCO family protein [Gammaproteobacteria bacterium]
MTIEKTLNNPDNQNNPKKSRTTLWIMIILFGLPYVAAIYFYYFADLSKISNQTNYGTIITPARQVNDIPLKKLNNTDFKLSEMRGKWILISIGQSSCQKSCQDNLYKMRQIRKALGEERTRINRVFLLTDTLNIQSFNSLLPDYSGMETIIPTDDNYQYLISGFSIAGEPTEDGIFVVDPLGNYMMAYPKDADANKILKDIRRLLKVSKIG